MFLGCFLTVIFLFFENFKTQIHKILFFYKLKKDCSFETASLVVVIFSTAKIYGLEPCFLLYKKKNFFFKEYYLYLVNFFII